MSWVRRANPTLTLTLTLTLTPTPTPTPTPSPSPNPNLTLAVTVTVTLTLAGVFQAVLDSLVSILPSLPPYTRFALVTFDDAVHFYEASDGGGVRQLVVADTGETCLPLPPEALLRPLEQVLP